MKKILAVLLVLIMVLGLVACGATTETTETTKTETTTTEKKEETKKEDKKEEAPAEKLEISFKGYTAGFTPAQETPVELYIEDYYDGAVDIELIQLDHADADAVSLSLAEGVVPDFMFAGYNREYMKEQGLIQYLDWDEMWEYMPDYMNVMAGLFGGEEGLRTLMTDSDGDIMYIPWSRFDYASTEGLNIRKDWLENLGLEVPETVDELVEVWRAFTFDDPDGNGEDDTYGYNFAHYSWGVLWGAFDQYYWSWYVNDDGKVCFSGVEDSTKEAIKFFASLYQEGIIDPESVSDDRAAMWDKWGNSKLGSMTLDPWMINNNAQTKTMLGDASFSDKMVYIDNLKDEAGNDLKVKGYIPIGFQFMIGIDATDAERQFIYKFLNDWIADPDFGWTLQYGIQGEGWEYNADGTINDLLGADGQQAKCDMGAYIFGIVPADTSLLPNMISDPYVLDAFDKSLSSEFYTTGKDFNLYPFSSEAYNEKVTDIDTVNDQYYYDAITGKIDVDSTWEAHVAELNSLGVTEILAEFQAAYDASK